MQLGIIGVQLLQLDQVAGTPLQAIPGRDEGSVVGSLARHLPGALGVVPRARFGQLGV